QLQQQDAARSRGPLPVQRQLFGRARRRERVQHVSGQGEERHLAVPRRQIRPDVAVRLQRCVLVFARESGVLSALSARRTKRKRRTQRPPLLARTTYVLRRLATGAYSALASAPCSDS